MNGQGCGRQLMERIFELLRQAEATRSEIRICSAVSVPEYRKKADSLARELRETDNAIQNANWTTELQ